MYRHTRKAKCDKANTMYDIAIFAVPTIQWLWLASAV